ncbi:tetratricopeptide repeat protein [Actinophytocola sp. KF-1]
MSEPLDLAEHDPEEYAGKTVDIHGREYLVTKIVAVGMEKVVCTVRNTRSGLTMHMLKIHREPATAFGKVRWDHTGRLQTRELADEPTARQDWVGGFMMPDEMLVPGLFTAPDVPAVVTLQTAIGVPFEPGDSPTAEMADKAAELHGAGDVEGSARLYLDVLDVNPDHTVALFNLSGILSGDPEVAAGFAARCFDVEPNLLAYVVNAGIAGLAAGNHGHVLVAHDVAAEKFPYDQQLKPAAVRAALALGYVERAYEIRMTAVSCPAVAEFDDEITEQMTGRLLASRLMARARTACLGGAPDLAAGLDLLRRAHECPGRHEDVQLNLALTHARLGDLEAADRLLEDLMAYPRRLEQAITDAVNLAYVRLRRGRYADADRLFGAVARLLHLRPGNDLVDLFPRPDRWVGARSATYPEYEGVVTGYLDEALRAAGPDDPVAFATALAEMYQEERRSLAELAARMTTPRPD